MACALRKQHRELLLQIADLYESQPAYPPIPADLLDGKDYKLILARLYLLEDGGWINVLRKNGRIRAIIPMMLP